MLLDVEAELQHNDEDGGVNIKSLLLGQTPTLCYFLIPHDQTEGRLKNGPAPGELVCPRIPGSSAFPQSPVLHLVLFPVNQLYMVHSCSPV